MRISTVAIVEWADCEGNAHSLMANVDGAFTENQSFFAKGSVFFLRPFLPFDNRLFLPTAMIAVVYADVEVEFVVLEAFSSVVCNVR
jgi:hypothetical protein